MSHSQLDLRSLTTHSSKRLNQCLRLGATVGVICNTTTASVFLKQGMFSSWVLATLVVACDRGGEQQAPCLVAKQAVKFPQVIWL